MAIFDARQLNHDLFTVTDGQLRPTASPVRIVLKPPTYDEALHELGEHRGGAGSGRGGAGRAGRGGAGRGRVGRGGAD